MRSLWSCSLPSCSSQKTEDLPHCGAVVFCPTVRLLTAGCHSCHPEANFDNLGPCRSTSLEPVFLLCLGCQHLSASICLRVASDVPYQLEMPGKFAKDLICWMLPTYRGSKLLEKCHRSCRKRSVSQRLWESRLLQFQAHEW